MWAGYSAAFGPPQAGDAWADVDEDQRSQGTGGDAGVLPVDGFVVGAQNESLRLGVIPAQPRDKANTFALQPFPMDIDGNGNIDLGLRPDVTLAKTITVLQRYAKEPKSSPRTQWSPSSTSQRARRPLRGFASARRLATGHTGGRGAITRPSQSRSLSSRPGATAIDPRLRAILGGSEADRESGTMSGIRATDTDDEDSSPPPVSAYRAMRMARNTSDFSDIVSDNDDDSEDEMPQDGFDYLQDDGEHIDDEDVDEDDFGGAFARPQQPAGYGEEAERQRLERLTFNSGHSISTPSGLVGQVHDTSFGSSEDDTRAKTSPSSPVGDLPKALTPEHLQSDLIDTLECQLCYMLLYEPLTTPCGHTFCRVCFARSLDHSSNCPLCRASMPSFSFFQDHPLNQGLVNLLNTQLGPSERANEVGYNGISGTRRRREDDGEEDVDQAYPQEDLLSMSRLGVFADSHPMSSHSAYHDKLREQEDEENITFGLRHLYRERAESVQREEAGLSQFVPIFVCTLAFPGMPTNLHIFEPRYRLMIRRCLQSKGPSQFGMVMPSRRVDSRTPGLSEYGTMLEIKSCQLLLDGRSMLETVGRRRFRLLEAGSLDGYTTGRIEYIDDDPAEVQAVEESSVLQSNAEASRRNRQFERRRQECERQDRSPSDDRHGDAMMSELQSHVDPYVADAAVQDPSASVQRSTHDAGDSPPSVVLPPLPGDREGGDTDVPHAVPAQRAGFGTMPMQSTLSDLINICVGFIEMLRTQTAPGLFDQIVTTYGPVPHPLETDKLGWWLGMVLPIDEIAKSSLLPVTSPRRRLEMIVEWIERIQAQWRPHA